MIQVIEYDGLAIVMVESGHGQRWSFDVTPQVFDGVQRGFGGFGEMHDPGFFILLVEEMVEFIRCRVGICLATRALSFPSKHRLALNNGQSSEGDVLSLRVGQDHLLQLNPLVSELLAAGVAETGLAAKTDLLFVGTFPVAALPGGIAHDKAATGQ